MHLPAHVKRRIAYTAGAVLLSGSLVLLLKPSSQQTAMGAQLSEQPSVAADVSGLEVDTLIESTVAPPPKAVAAQDATLQKLEAGDPHQKQGEQKVTFETYTVVEGDHIGTIAEKFGLKWSTILWANDLTEDDYLQIGQELIIPSVDAFVVKVNEGDTLWDLATDAGANPDDVVLANPGIDPGALQPGSLLVIPGGEPPTRRMVATSRGGASRGRSTTFDAWPAYGEITSWFGGRVHPVWGTNDFHNGVDIGVGTGTPLQAVKAGTVTMAGWYGGYGKTVQIDHGGGITTLYAHMSQIEVEVGQEVSAGERIGLSGNTGTTTGPHLHFVVFSGGSPIDPMPMLP